MCKNNIYTDDLISKKVDICNILEEKSQLRVDNKMISMKTKTIEKYSDLYVILIKNNIRIEGNG